VTQKGRGGGGRRSADSRGERAAALRPPWPRRVTWFVSVAVVADAQRKISGGVMVERTQRSVAKGTSGVRMHESGCLVRSLGARCIGSRVRWRREPSRRRWLLLTRQTHATHREKKWEAYQLKELKGLRHIQKIPILNGKSHRDDPICPAPSSPPPTSPPPPPPSRRPLRRR